MLEEAAQQGGADKRLEELITTAEFVHVHPDHPLNVALERLGASQQEIVPVVSRADARKLEGIVTLQAVLAQYGVAAPRDADSQRQR
jgi:CBS domain-containing protein